MMDSDYPKSGLSTSPSQSNQTQSMAVTHTLLERDYSTWLALGAHVIPHALLLRDEDQ